MWAKIKSAYTTAGKQILGHAKLTHKKWMSLDLWNAIEKRQATKVLLIDDPKNEQLLSDYSFYRKLIKKLARRDKRIESEEIAERAKSALLTHNSQELYNATRQLTNSIKRNAKKPLKDKDGNLLCTSEEQLARWHEHFQKLLTRYRSLPGKEPSDDANPVLDIPTEQPIFELYYDSWCILLPRIKLFITYAMYGP
ncbi:unnamed protein product, partial [Brenthis ino]